MTSHALPTFDGVSTHDIMASKPLSCPRAEIERLKAVNRTLTTDLATANVMRRKAEDLYRIVYNKIVAINMENERLSMANVELTLQVLYPPGWCIARDGVDLPSTRENPEQT